MDFNLVWKVFFFVQLWHHPVICIALVLLLLKHSSSVKRNSTLVKICRKKSILLLWYRDIGNLVRHPDIVVLLHPFRMSSFSVNSFYSVEGWDITKGEKTTASAATSTSSLVKCIWLSSSGFLSFLMSFNPTALLSFSQESQAQCKKL